MQELLSLKKLKMKIKFVTRAQLAEFLAYTRFERKIERLIDWEKATRLNSVVCNKY